jgi:large subunit ribosomal protein L13
VDTLSYKTVSANKATVKKEWVVVDATDQVIGRLGAKVAKILRGTYKPNFTPNVDCGDNVIIINADKAILTGKKWADREYLSFSGYPGGQKSFTPGDVVKGYKGYERLFKHVVKGMLPKSRLGVHILNNLYIYEGPEHKHEAQSPKTIDINSYK